MRNFSLSLLGIALTLSGYNIATYCYWLAAIMVIIIEINIQNSKHENKKTD